MRKLILTVAVLGFAAFAWSPSASAWSVTANDDIFLMKRISPKKVKVWLNNKKIGVFKIKKGRFYFNISAHRLLKNDFGKRRYIALVKEHPQKGVKIVKVKKKKGRVKYIRLCVKKWFVSKKRSKRIHFAYLLKSKKWKKAKDIGFVFKKVASPS